MVVSLCLLFVHVSFSLDPFLFLVYFVLSSPSRRSKGLAAQESALTLTPTAYLVPNGLLWALANMQVGMAFLSELMAGVYSPAILLLCILAWRLGDRSWSRYVLVLKDIP